MNKKLMWILIAVLAIVLVAGIILAETLIVPQINGDTQHTDPSEIETTDGADPTGTDNEGTDPTAPSGNEATKPEATTPSGGTESGNTNGTGNTGNTGSNQPTGPEISVDDGAEPTVGDNYVIEFEDLLDAGKNGEGQD